MLPFWISITILSLVQAALVALPRPAASPRLTALRSRWWALALPGPLAIVVTAIALDATAAHALAWLALFAVPPLAALALAGVVRGGHVALAALVIPLFAVAWGLQDALGGDAAALALSALACASLGWLLVCVVPSAWLKSGIYLMAAIDAFLIAADLLQGPNAVLNSASPGDLPQLQYASLGSASMGFGDLFVAATLGALLASERRLQITGALLTATFALGFDLLFFAVDSLPATVPVALALAATDVLARRRPMRVRAESREPQPAPPAEPRSIRRRPE